MASGHDGPFLGRAGWVMHRIVASFWSLPLLAVLAAMPAALALMALDGEGLAGWLVAQDLSPVATADTAKDLVAVAVGINAAFITLYFSLTLLVLTVASSNLGVRLVDRWLDKRLVRVSLAGLSFSLVFSLAMLATIDGQADLAELPLGGIAAVIALQALNVVMLTVALHDLGRTIFVDRSIHNLARDSMAGPVAVKAAAPYDSGWAQAIRSPREGYVEGNGLSHLARKLAGHPGRIRICAAPGQHVLEGETLALLESGGADEAPFRASIPVGDFRSDGEGAVFRVRLLVEIAARALSPAVNDFYTAMAAADRLAAVMAAQAGSWVDEDQVAVFSKDDRFELPGQDFHGLFEDPLNAFRQAACQYPSVTIRMVDNYRRIIEHHAMDDARSGLRDFLIGKARELAEHGEACAQFDCDKADIKKAFDAIAGNFDARPARAI